MNNNIVLLLTATIDPGSMPNTALNDSNTRLEQYCEAVNFYLLRSTCKILFVENSGIDVSTFFREQIVQNRLEVLTFRGNDFPKSLGKGYGECLILEHALNNSLFLSMENTIVLKVTGRLKVLNINYFIKRCLNTDFDVAAEILGHFKYADSRFFIASPKFLRFFLKNKENINDQRNQNFEDVLKSSIFDAISQGMSLLLFSQIVRIKGISGTNNSSYSTSYIFWLLRSFKRKLGLRFMNLKGL